VALSSAPASAVVEIFSGSGASGSDQLGMTWNTGVSFIWDNWAMPGVLQGDAVFNPGNISSDNGTYATQFSITLVSPCPTARDCSA
jgi:hypothetical protein